MMFLRRLLAYLQRRHRVATYQDGTKLSRFIAKDIRREVLIVSSARISEGIIRVRIRTTNVLYVARGYVTEGDFGPEVDMPVQHIWHWSGQSWGGLPDGTSIADHLQQPVSPSSEDDPV